MTTDSPVDVGLLTTILKQLDDSLHRQSDILHRSQPCLNIVLLLGRFLANLRPRSLLPLILTKRLHGMLESIALDPYIYLTRPDIRDALLSSIGQG